MSLATLITGDESSVVDGYDPISRKKISILGYSIIIPIVMVTMSVFLTMNIILEKSISLSISAAIVGAIIITIIEITIIRGTNNALVGIFRLVLALLINISSSLAIDLALFENDVNIVLNNQYMTKINELQFASTAVDNKIISLDDKITALENKKYSLEYELTEEVGGISGTRRTGRGPRAKSLESMIVSINNDIITHRGNLNTLKERRIDNIDKNIDTYKEGYIKGRMLDKIKALFVLKDTQHIVLYVWILLTLLFLFLELIPLSYKFLSGKSAYENNINVLSNDMKRNIKRR